MKLLRVKGVWQGFETVIPAKAGIHGSKKRGSLMCLAWVSAFAGPALRRERAGAASKPALYWTTPALTG